LSVSIGMSGKPNDKLTVGAEFTSKPEKGKKSCTLHAVQSHTPNTSFTGRLNFNSLGEHECDIGFKHHIDKKKTIYSKMNSKGQLSSTLVLTLNENICLAMSSAYSFSRKEVLNSEPIPIGMAFISNF
jgi:hypothetical protein